MESRPDTIELDRTVEAYAGAVLHGDHAAAEEFVAERAIDAGHAAGDAAAAKRPFARFEVLARAKYERQFIVKIRWRGDKGLATWQTRWGRDAGGRWQIVEIEDLTTTRSSSSDALPTPGAAVS